jgi:Cu+-exporting ATPase
MAIDPVCGMEVDERTAKEKTIHEGTTYYFCSKDCREEFLASPADYLGGEEEMTGT